MRANRYRDAAAFTQRVMPLLMRDEAVNHLILGILWELSGGSASPSKQEPLLCAVEEDDGEVIGVAINTAISLLLTNMPPAAMEALLDLLAVEKPAVSMTAGCSPMIGRFANRWAEQNHLTAKLGHR